MHRYDRQIIGCESSGYQHRQKLIGFAHAGYDAAVLRTGDTSDAIRAARSMGSMWTTRPNARSSDYQMYAAAWSYAALYLDTE